MALTHEFNRLALFRAADWEGKGKAAIFWIVSMSESTFVMFMMLMYELMGQQK